MRSPYPSILTNSYLLALGLLLCGSSFLQGANADDAVPPDEISWDDDDLPDVISSIANDLKFDENQKLAQHYLVFPANRPDCPTNYWEAGHGSDAVALEGDALVKVFPHYGNGLSYLGRDKENELDEDEEDTRCMAACLEKGTDIALAGYTMPHYHFVGENDESTINKKVKFDEWYRQSCKKVEVCLINYTVKERELEVFWMNEGTNELVKTSSLGYSERGTKCFHSYLGHKFLVMDEESGFEETITIEHVMTRAFGTSPPSSSQRFDDIEQVEEKVKGAFTYEWLKHKQVKRTFSSLGFAKGRLPNDVFANMGAFYYNNQHYVVNEEWEGKGVFVNWWETDVKFVAIPWGIKKHWQLRLMELVSEWSGVEIEETSMYGLRQYEEGARLLSHVDRVSTHAVSLIVNIAQENLANPWPVEVFDHADRLHEVNMEAGDIVYYESAKNLHSRNRPLTCKKGGCRFVNLFTHYRPLHDGDTWYHNLSDMPNRPPPLLEGQTAYDTEPSACRRLDGNFSDNLLGIGKVQCEDKSLGPYMSPTMFKLREQGDMFRWWKATANPNFMGFDENNKPTYKEALPQEDDDDDDEDVIVSPAGAGFDVEDYYEDDDEDDEYDDDEYDDEDEDELGFDHQEYIDYHEYGQARGSEL